MLPIMVRADEEAIRSVPVDLQEAGAALGAARWRVVRSVVLRGSLPGLVAGNLLALARAMGETAPLVFTLAAPSFAMTLLIYTDGDQTVPRRTAAGLGDRPGAAGRGAGVEHPGSRHRLVTYKEGEMTAAPDAGTLACPGEAADGRHRRCVSRT